MEQINLIDKVSSVIIIGAISSLFVIIGIFFSKGHSGLKNYLVANRSINTLSLTTSFIASALGTWILFGPASAATWGGIGAVLGYALGTAAPLIFLIFLGKKFRDMYPDAYTLIEVIRYRFGYKLFKLILLLSIFYMIIFLIAEVTAVAILVRYLSGTNLWITSLLVISSSLIYTLYGGLRASIFTDKVQFFILFILLFTSFSYLVLQNHANFNFNFISENKPNLLSYNYLPNFTAGLTFFIAVAATNLFHQGNWQRVYAAKNNKILIRSLIFSTIIIIPVIFMMGITGLVAVSENSLVTPDLAFFSLLLKDANVYISILIIFLAISLTVSSIDTLINAIASLIIVDGNKVIKSKVSFLNISKLILIFISFITFIVASRGISILYLFLLADLFCCSAVIVLFYSFYKKQVDENNIYFCIILGLTAGLLFFPTTDFSKSLLVGIILPSNMFPNFVTNSLLFCSFIIATFLPLITLKLINKFYK